MAAMSDLTDFLTARLDEDEAAARNVLALDYSEGRWRWQSHRPKPYRSALVNERDQILVAAMNDDVWPSAAVADHITRHDPARVLATVAAHRAIVRDHGGRHVCEDGMAGERWDDDANDVVEAPCDVMRIIGTIYADHPDYRDEWRPETD